MAATPPTTSPCGLPIPSGAAAEIGRTLKARHGVSKLGVILMDSHRTPMRRGTNGISIDFYASRLFGTIAERPTGDDRELHRRHGRRRRGSKLIPIVIIRSWRDLVFNDEVGQAGFFIPPVMADRMAQGHDRCRRDGRPGARVRFGHLRT